MLPKERPLAETSGADAWSGIMDAAADTTRDPSDCG